VYPRRQIGAGDNLQVETENHLVWLRPCPRALRTPGGKVRSPRASLLATNSPAFCGNCEFRFTNRTRFRRLNLLLSGYYLRNPLGQALNFIDFGPKQP
jgi:hypothetical protein